LIAIVSEKARATLGRLGQASKRVLHRAPGIARIGSLGAGAAADVPSAPKRTTPTNVGIRANAVTFHSSCARRAPGRTAAAPRTKTIGRRSRSEGRRKFSKTRSSSSAERRRCA
jgi:hypothetical protein